MQAQDPRVLLWQCCYVSSATSRSDAEDPHLLLQSSASDQCSRWLPPETLCGSRFHCFNCVWDLKCTRELKLFDPNTWWLEVRHFFPRPAQSSIILMIWFHAHADTDSLLLTGWFTAVNGLTVQLRLVLGENRPLLLSHTLQGEMDQRRIHLAINTSQESGWCVLFLCLMVLFYSNRSTWPFEKKKEISSFLVFMQLLLETFLYFCFSFVENLRLLMQMCVCVAAADWWNLSVWKCVSSATKQKVLPGYIG